MAIKRKGVVAVPGEYVYGDRTERKSAEELRAAAERQPILALTYGHPTGGLPKASDFIGTVAQKWNEEKQRVDGDFWFYDEIPDAIREKIVNEWPTPISAGFTVESVQDSAQKGIFYTHIAVLKDSEDPKCPLGKCGVNVRMESNSPVDYRYEKAQSPAEPAAPIEPPKKEPITMEVLQAQLAELKALVAGLNRPATAPAVTKTEEPKEETPEQPAEEIPPITFEEPPKPKMVIPAGVSSGVASKKENMTEDGWFIIEPKKKK